MSRPNRAEDRIGERHGNLVLEKLVGITGNGRNLYLCRCDCGGSVIKTPRDIQMPEGRRDCGCMSVPVRKAKKTDIAPPRKDCAAYIPEKNNCAALYEMFCVTKGECPFYKRR